MWKIELIREISMGNGGVKYVMVAVDYFTKWVEVEPLAIITAEKLNDFFYRAIVCRVGVSFKLVSYNTK